MMFLFTFQVLSLLYFAKNMTAVYQPVTPLTHHLQKLIELCLTHPLQNGHANFRPTPWAERSSLTQCA